MGIFPKPTGWKYGFKKVWNHDQGKLGGIRNHGCSSNSVIILLIASLHPFEGSYCERNVIAIFGTPKTSAGKEQGCIASIIPKKWKKTSGYVFCLRRFDQFSYPPIQFTNLCLEMFHGKSSLQFGNVISLVDIHPLDNPVTSWKRFLEFSESSYCSPQFQLHRRKVATNHRGRWKGGGRGGRIRERSTTRNTNPIEFMYMIHIHMYFNLYNIYIYIHDYYGISTYLLIDLLWFFQLEKTSQSFLSEKNHGHGILRSVPSDPVISITTSQHLHELMLWNSMCGTCSMVRRLVGVKLPNFSGNPLFFKGHVCIIWSNPSIFRGGDS